MTLWHASTELRSQLKQSRLMQTAGYCAATVAKMLRAELRRGLDTSG